MALIANILLILVAVLHLYFLVLEMFLWTKPVGLKAFGLSLSKAQDSKKLAMNQGLYNGFLAFGLLYGFFCPSPQIGIQFKIFFLVCIVVAGVFGALTVSKKILYIQAFPAIICLLFIFLRN